jgi:predicted ATPase
MAPKSQQIDSAQLAVERLGEATNWFVLTGPPSSGKTSVLLELAARGFRTSPDVSRQYLESLLAGGATKDEARANPAGLQRSILTRMLDVESRLPVNEPVFLDYGLPDNLAFWEIANLELISSVWRAALRFRYRHIFLFDPLPFVDDSIRVESHDRPKQLSATLSAYYRALGYQWTRVPPAPISERLALVLDVTRSLVGGVSPSSADS